MSEENSLQWQLTRAFTAVAQNTRVLVVGPPPVNRMVVVFHALEKISAD